MTCVQKEYEVKIKNGTGSMTTAKSEVLIGLLLKNCYSVGAMNLLGQILASDGDFPPSSK